MELVAEEVDGAVVLNAQNICTSLDTNCRNCSDVGGLVHNWLVSTNLRYVMIDLQDEKDVCPTFLIELLQLRKRLRIPFYFAGVMDRPRKILDDYNYLTDEPLFITPEEALVHMKRYHPDTVNLPFENVAFGKPILGLRARHLQRLSGEESDESAEAEI